MSSGTASTIAALKALNIGDEITFRSKNQNDTVLYTGTYQGFMGYSVIQGMLVPQAYNESVRQVDPSITSDYTKLNYIILIVDNNADTPTPVVMAAEWIADGSLTVLDQVLQVTVVVDDPFNNPQNIVDVLTLNRYSAYIQSSNAANT